MVFQKRKYTLKLDLSFCYISYVLKMISFRLKEEKRSLDADWSRAWCRFLLFFTAPHCTYHEITIFSLKPSNGGQATCEYLHQFHFFQKSSFLYFKPWFKSNTIM